MAVTRKSRKAPAPSTAEPINIPKPKAWAPPDYTLADVYAIQAVANGGASPDQQKRAMDYIIRVLAGTYDMAYRPDSARDTDFALGKQWVGQCLVFFVNINPGVLKESK